MFNNLFKKIFSRKIFRTKQISKEKTKKQIAVITVIWGIVIFVLAIFLYDLSLSPDLFKSDFVQTGDTIIDGYRYVSQTDYERGIEVIYKYDKVTGKVLEGEIKDLTGRIIKKEKYNQFTQKTYEELYQYQDETANPIIKSIYYYDANQTKSVFKNGKKYEQRSGGVMVVTDLVAVNNKPQPSKITIIKDDQIQGYRQFDYEKDHVTEYYYKDGKLIGAKSFILTSFNEAGAELYQEEFTELHANGVPKTGIRLFTDKTGHTWEETRSYDDQGRFLSKETRAVASTDEEGNVILDLDTEDEPATGSHNTTTTTTTTGNSNDGNTTVITGGDVVNAVTGFFKKDEKFKEFTDGEGNVYKEDGKVYDKEGKQVGNYEQDSDDNSISIYDKNGNFVREIDEIGTVYDETGESIGYYDDNGEYVSFDGFNADGEKIEESEEIDKAFSGTTDEVSAEVVADNIEQPSADEVAENIAKIYPENPPIPENPPANVYTSTEDIAPIFDSGGTQDGIKAAKEQLEGSGVSTNDNIIIVVLGWINFSLVFAGILAFAGIVYAGFLMVANFGSEEAGTKGKTIIMWSVIGLVVIFSAYAIVSTILNAAK